MKRRIVMQEEKSIVVLGPQGTNGHEAAAQFMQINARALNICFCNSNAEILPSVVNQTYDFGVTPTENSSMGIIRQIMDFWLQEHSDPSRVGIQVIGDVVLPVHHCLMVHSDTTSVEQVDTVISHPAALDQCHNNLERLGLMVQVPSQSTAGAAAQVARQSGEKKNLAAIASQFAADRYQLKVLEPMLHDRTGNSTRLHVIGRTSTQPTGNDTTAILFWLPNKCGALARMIQIISSAECNMSCIHSIPLGERSRYAFYVEFDGHQYDSVVNAMLQLIAATSQRLVVLGSFPKAC